MKRRQPADRPADRTKTAGQRSKHGSKTKSRLSARKRGMIVAGSILGILILIAGAILIYIYDLLGNVNTVPPGQQTIPSEYDQPAESLVNPLPDKKGIYNILLLGVDSRDQERTDERSDSMMILTIDQIHGKIKLTSLQRDMLVYIPGVKEPEKLNAANALGGPLLVMRTVNDTLRLNITKYMLVNMYGMEQIVDIAGGVWLDIEDPQIDYINQAIIYANYIYPETKPSPLISKAGRQLLDGRQAVAYARIRKLDSDYKRMERQRAVIQALLDAFLKADLGTKNKMLAAGLGLITTNLTKDEILKIGINTVPALSGQIDQLQVPIQGFFKEYSGSEWVNLCDFNGMIPFIQNFIFGESYPFDKVKVIPGAPNSGTALPSPTRKPTATPKPSAPAVTTETLPPPTPAATAETTSIPEPSITGSEPASSATSTEPVNTSAATAASTTPPPATSAPATPAVSAPHSTG